MVAHVEQKRWWIQMPISWGVKGVLVLALLVSVVVGAAQVRGRDATIADQAAGISQQAVTLQQSREQVVAQHRAAEVAIQHDAGGASGAVADRGWHAFTPVPAADSTSRTTSAATTPGRHRRRVAASPLVGG